MSTKARTRESFPRMKVRGKAKRARRAEWRRAMWEIPSTFAGMAASGDEVVRWLGVVGAAASAAAAGLTKRDFVLRA